MGKYLRLAAVKWLRAIHEILCTHYREYEEQCMVMIVHRVTWELLHVPGRYTGRPETVLQ